MSRRRVEVCVVLAIVCGLVGLLVPAVLRVRAAAARMSCAGHFCQMGVALHSYADANPLGRGGKPLSTYPAGTIAHPGLPPEERLSWWVSVLPYVEQGNVYSQFDLNRGPGDPLNARAASNRWRHIVCPASGEYRYGPSGESWKSATPLTHYVGVAGVGMDAATLPLGHPRAGVFGYDRRTTIPEDITDGTANTLMLIETANNPGHWAHGGFATVRAFEPGAGSYIGLGRAFGGFHDGGYTVFESRERLCTVGMANGSYRTFTNKTDPTVLEALATVGGQETLPPNW